MLQVMGPQRGGHDLEPGRQQLVGRAGRGRGGHRRAGAGPPANSPSLCIISTTVTPGCKRPCSSRTGTMKQWGPKDGDKTD